MTKSSLTQRLAEADAEGDGGSGNVRMSTIPCGLKRIMSKHEFLVPHFAEYASSIGIMRHVISMVANHIAIGGAAIDKGDFFLFYTRVWSAVDRHVTGKQGSKDHFDTEVAAFFDTHKDDHLPDTVVPVMCRQQECNALSVATVMHMHSFPERVKRWFAANIAVFYFEAGVRATNVTALASKLWRYVSGKGEFSVPNMKKCLEKDDASVGHIFDRLVAFAREEYMHLESFRQRVHGASLAQALGCNKHAHLLLPHMQRVSTASEQLLAQWTTLAQDGNAAPPYDDLVENDVFEEEDVGNDSHEPPSTPWRARDLRPSPFTLMPVAKLKRAMVYYGMTELQSMFSNLHTRYGKKRTNDGASKNPFEELKHADLEGKLHLLFNLKRVKAKWMLEKEDAVNTGGWRLSCFRTDGIKATLTFCSGMQTAQASPNVCHLCDAGYNIPQPCDCVNVHSTPRGLFKVDPTRNDMANGTIQPTDRVTVVDPGFHRPVQCASLDASQLVDGEPTAVDLATTAAFDFVDVTTWMRDSGRLEREQKEQHRREVNTEYKKALEDLSTKRRRSCLSFADYSKEMMATLKTRVEELVCHARSLFRWKYARKLQSFLDKVADTLFQRTSCRVNRQNGVEHLTPEQRIVLKQRLRDAKAMRASKNVVFFGDGTFSCTQRGHVSIPKKRLLKHLAVRGLTFLLCEKFTSKRCPCGHDDLRDGESNGGVRVRVHQTDGGVCNVLQTVRDRDELACVNMLLATSTAFRHVDWPAHLTRQG
jgi:hypothetical protein